MQAYSFLSREKIPTRGGQVFPYMVQNVIILHAPVGGSRRCYATENNAGSNSGKELLPGENEGNDALTPFAVSA